MLQIYKTFMTYITNLTYITHITNAAKITPKSYITTYNIDIIQHCYYLKEQTWKY